MKAEQCQGGHRHPLAQSSIHTSIKEKENQSSLVQGCLSLMFQGRHRQKDREPRLSVLVLIDLVHWQPLAGQLPCPITTWEAAAGVT